MTTPRPFNSLLIANRGEIACRIIATAKRMGLRTIAVYSHADAHARHAAFADQAVLIGPAPPLESYLKIEAVIDAARASGAQAVHPGYGFLSENADFAEACVNAGLVFVGPPADAIRAMGLKGAAKALMEKAGVPVVPGYHGDDQRAKLLAREAERIGFPVLIKAVAGGGGKGMRRVDSAADFTSALASAQREAKAAFGIDRVLVERYVARPRHIEIQVFADAHGNALSLFERDCSLQRRHQKVIEEAPAPGIPEEMRAAMGEAAVKAARAVGYLGAGTVEFIADASDGLKADRYFFMEMNTRLQVEHRVTEAITGQDLVEWQLRVAAGEPLLLKADELRISGHAIEARLYAEDPANNFFPSPGTLHRLKLPQSGAGLVVDSAVREGDEVTLHYDPMIAKLVAHGSTREAAIDRLRAALQSVEVAGVRTNAAFLIAALGQSEFRTGAVDTGFIDRHLETLLGSAVPAGDILAAAALFLALGPPESIDGPWMRRDGWRLGGVPARPGAPLRLSLAGAGEPVEVLIAFRGDGITARVAGSELLLTYERDGDDGLTVTIAPPSAARRNRRFRFARVADKLFAMIDGATHELQIAPVRVGAEAVGDLARGVAAPLAGRIVSVQAKVGQSVKRGQALVVLEAMKMEHTLVAESEAVIERVDCRAGDQVKEGQVIVAFAPA
jgi:3-methylcrotonyl-CoA carboxylase alpha subunit